MTRGIYKTFFISKSRAFSTTPKGLEKCNALGAPRRYSERRCEWYGGAETDPMKQVLPLASGKDPRARRQKGRN